MPHAVRCPHCRALSQVGDGAVGRTVACPNCGAAFRAAPLPPPPVAARLPADDPFHPDPRPDPDGLTGVLLGLALVPLGVPVLWLAARLVVPAEPVFSLVLPLAVGLGVAGLAVGVGLVRGWGHAARVRGVLVLAVGSYLLAGLLFAVHKDWAAAGRRLFGPTQIKWRKFTAPDKGYAAQVPEGRETAGGEGPAGDWPLRTFQFAAGKPDDRRGVWAVRYTLADGVPPGLAGAADDAWFAAVRDAVVSASGGEVTAEAAAVVSGKPARDLRLTLPQQTFRAVRVVRAGDRLVYAAAEGLFLSGDGAEVQTFLKGLAVR